MDKISDRENERRRAHARKHLCEMIDKYGIRELQNHPANLTQDHMTACGFFRSEAEFARHAEYLRGRIERAS